MKKIMVFVLVLAVCGVGYTAYRRVGPSAEPFRAYQRQATSEEMGKNRMSGTVLQRFGAPTVEIDSIEYHLEHEEWTDDASVELDVLQVVQWRYRQDGPSRPEYRKSRHHVVMERTNGKWQAAQVTKEDVD